MGKLGNNTANNDNESVILMQTDIKAYATNYNTQRHIQRLREFQKLVQVTLSRILHTSLSTYQQINTDTIKN